MNILIITQMYSQPDDVGDNRPTKTVNYFAREWVAAGHNVLVIHCSSKFPLPFYYAPKFITNAIASKTSNIIPPIESRKTLKREENGVKVYRIPMLKAFPGRAYSENIIAKTETLIKQILLENAFVPEIVVGHFANPSLEIVCDLAREYNAKSSIVFHHDCTKQNITKYRMEKNLHNVGAIGVRSLPEAKEVQALLGLAELPFLCYSGVPNEAIKNAETECNKHDFTDGVKHIYVGSLIARKHLDSTIEAFVSTYGDSNSRATLEVVGGGVEEQNLKNLTEKLNASNKVNFVGRVAREDVLRRMKESNVFTLISDDEVYGMVYIEAMLQGCLVIASKGGGFDGIIIDGENGFLCNPGDAKMLSSIYRRIEELSVEERNRIGQRAINTAKRFSEAEVAENYLNDILDCNEKKVKV